MIRAANAQYALLGCIALGRREYYRHFGFSPTLVEALQAPFSGPHFMTLEIEPGVIEGGGTVRYAKAFGVDG